MDLFDIDEAVKNDRDGRRIKKLEKLISGYQKSYYNGEGEISDAEFDKLWDELKALDPENSILKKVGADSGNFSKARHVMPMGSQEKAADPEQFMEWAEKHVYDEYFVEYKLDGASLELQYSKGKLVRAVTRGDGHIGDDITSNARKMQGVPAEIRDSMGNPVDFTGGIRGEVIMTHSVHQNYFSDKANCRNAANGLMKRKDGQGSEYLTLITYDALCTEGKSPFSDEEEKISFLKNSGFNTVVLNIVKTPQEVIDYRSTVMEKRAGLEYDIDGLVIKERKIDFQDASRARPDRQIAFKFSLEEAVSVIRDVEWSESGATYTPVAIFDPVELAGTTVQRASLANPDTLRALGVKLGSHVVVVKRGEIIPKIQSVVPSINGEEKNLKDIPFPEKCTCCGTKLVDAGSRLYCPEKSCRKKILHQLYKWIECAGIRDLGESIVLSLFNDGKLNSISDIYSLTEDVLTPYFLNEESMASDKKSLGAQKLAQSILSHRSVRLSQFVAGFDIEGIGEQMVEKVVQSGISSLDKLLESTASDFEGIYGFAEITARGLYDGLRDNEEEMKKLSSIVNIEKAEGGLLEGKSFCFTGELVTMKRSDAEALVKENGGSVKSSVTKDLSYLVTNDTSSGSSKNQKAAKLSIPVITEKEFLSLLEK